MMTDKPKLYICYTPDLLDEDELHVLFNIPDGYGLLELKPVNSWSTACSLARSLVLSEPNRKAVCARRADGPSHLQDLVADLHTLVSPAGWVILINGRVEAYEPSGVRS